MRNERKPTGRPATFDVSFIQTRLIQASMSLFFAAGLVMTLAIVSPTANAQMFLDEGDEVSGAGVSDSVTASPKGKATSQQRKTQSKAAWSEKRKSHSQKQAKAVAKSQQKRASAKSAASVAGQSQSKGSKTGAKNAESAKSKSVASATAVASSPKSKSAKRGSEAKSGQNVAALAAGRSTSKSTVKSSAKAVGNKGRSPASASTFATTKKSCPLQVSPGAKENIGVTKFPRKLWVQDAGNPSYYKVVNREGREGFVKKSCFE